LYEGNSFRESLLEQYGASRATQPVQQQCTTDDDDDNDYNENSNLKKLESTEIISSNINQAGKCFLDSTVHAQTAFNQGNYGQDQLSLCPVNSVQVVIYAQGLIQ